MQDRTKPSLAKNRTYSAWIGKIGNPKLLEDKDISKDLDSFVEGDYNSNDREKLGPKRQIISFRVGLKPRILCANFTLDKNHFLVALESLPEHEYLRSRFLQDGVYAEWIENNLPMLHEQINAILAKNNNSIDIAEFKKNYKLSCLEFSGKRLVEYSDEQQPALQAPLPLIILGVPGAGKTLLLPTRIGMFLEQDPSPNLRVLISTINPLLIKTIEDDWNNPGEKRVNFKHWIKVIEEQDPLLIDVPVVGYDHFERVMQDFIKGYRGRCKANEKGKVKGKVKGKEKETKYLPEKLVDKILNNLYTLYLEMMLIDVEEEWKTSESYYKDEGKDEGDEEYKTLQILIKAFCKEAYKIYMDNLNQIDKTTKKRINYNPLFLKFIITQPYDLIAFDEFIDCSPRMILQILKLGKEFIFSGDPTQNVLGQRSLRKFLTEQLNNIKQQVTIVELYESWRSPEVSIKLQMAIRKILFNLINGITEDIEKLNIKLPISRPKEETKKGTFIWANSIEDDMVKKFISSHAQSTYTVIIPSLVDKEKAINEFPGATVLTTEQVKGGEDSEVVIRLPFEEAFKLLAKANLDFDPETAGKQVNYPKASGDSDLLTKYLVFFKRFFANVSRTTDTIIIIQPVKKEYKKLFDFIMQEVGEQNIEDQKKAVAIEHIATTEELEDKVRGLIVNGNDEEALRLWKERLGRLQRDFNKFKQQVLNPPAKKKPISSSASSSTTSASTSRSSTLFHATSSSTSASTSVSTFLSAKPNSATNTNSSNKEKQPQAPKSTIVPQLPANTTSTTINISPQVRKMLEEMIQAVKNGKLNKINQLHQQIPDLINMHQNGWSAIHVAAFDGQEKSLESLINRGASINALTNSPEGVDGASPLILSIDSKKPNAVSIAKTLIKKKADVNIATDNGMRAIHRATWLGKKEITQALCEAHPELIEQLDDNERTPLYLATIGGHVEICEYLLRHKANPIVFCNFPEDPEWHGESILDWAISKSHFTIAKMLISVVDDLSYLQHSFEYALRSKNKDIIEAFLKKDRKYFLNTNLNGQSPLTILASCGDVENAKYLIQQGANVNFIVNAPGKKFHGQTALTIAIQFGHTDIALELINAQSIDLLAPCTLLEFTAAQLACEFKRLDILKAIINKKPEALLQKTPNGRNLILHASISLNKEIIDYLIEEVEKKIKHMGTNNHFNPQERDELILSLAYIRGESQSIIEYIEKNNLTPNIVTSLLFFAIKLKNQDILEALYLKDPQLLHTKMPYDQNALHLVASIVWVEGIIYFLTKGLDVNTAINFPSKNFHGNTPLAEAIYKNNTEAAFVLIKHGANLMTPYGEFHRAIKFRRKAILEAMLKTNLDLINLPNNFNETPLHVAAETGDKEIVDFLIQKGANVNASINKPDHKNHGRTPIFCAIAEGHTEVAKSLIHAGANLNHYCKGMTPVHFAVDCKKFEIVQAILKDLQTINQKDEAGRTLLISAISDKRIFRHIIYLLSEENHNITKHPKMLEFLDAIIEGKTRAAIRLIESGIDIDFTILGLRPIHIAAYFGRLAIVQAMISKDQRLLNARNLFNETPLIFAILRRRKAIFDYLVHEKADLDVPIEAPGNPYHLKTAMIRAIEHNAVEFVSLLMKSGASTVIKFANREYDVIHQVAFIGKIESFKTITNLKPELLTKPDSMGHTALFWASATGKTQIVDFLTSKGIELSEAEKNKLELLKLLSIKLSSFHPIKKLSPGVALVNVVIYGAAVSTLEPYKEELSKGELKEHCQKLLSQDMLELLKVKQLETQQEEKVEVVKPQEIEKPEEEKSQERKPDEVLSFGLLERKQKETKLVVSQDDREQQATKPLVIQEELDMQPETSQRVRR